MLAAVLCLVNAVFLSQTSATTTGGWSSITDADELFALRDLLYTVKSDVLTLVTAYGDCDGCTLEDPFAVITAEYQMVAGKNYRVHMGVGYIPNMKMFDIEFFVPLPVNGVAQDPTELRMMTTTTTTTTAAPTVIAGGWQQISDANELLEVQQLLAKVKPELMGKLALGGCQGCSVDDAVVVQSAQRQVVAGTNYQAHIAVAERAPEFDVSFFVALPANDDDQVPTNLQVLTTTATATTTTAAATATSTTGVVLGDAVAGGYSALTQASDLSAVRGMLNSVKSEVIALVSANGCDGCTVGDELTVVSAQCQIVAGTNYRVHLGVGAASQAFDITFFVPLPVNGVAQMPTNLEMAPTLVADGNTVDAAAHTNKKLTQIYVAVSIVAIVLIASFVTAIVCVRKRRNQNDEKMDTLLAADEQDQPQQAEENADTAFDETL